MPPEFVFDATLGDIFVDRTAGEVVDTVTLGSIDYAIKSNPIDKAVRANARDNCETLEEHWPYHATFDFLRHRSLVSVAGVPVCW